MLRICTILAFCLLFFLAVNLIIVQLRPDTSSLNNQAIKRNIHCAMLMNIALLCMIQLRKITNMRQRQFREIRGDIQMNTTIRVQTKRKRARKN
ncbi:hypothetical protein PENTCL1PPCAC_20432, partial [Pristionchus entomophagus]